MPTGDAIRRRSRAPSSISKNDLVHVKVVLMATTQGRARAITLLLLNFSWGCPTSVIKCRGTLEVRQVGFTERWRLECIVKGEGRTWTARTFVENWCWHGGEKQRQFRRDYLAVFCRTLTII